MARIRGQGYPLREWASETSGVPTRQSAARFLKKAEAKMLSLNIAPNGASFRAGLAKEACFLVKNRRFFRGFCLPMSTRGRSITLFSLLHLP